MATYSWSPKGSSKRNNYCGHFKARGVSGMKPRDREEKLYKLIDRRDRDLKIYRKKVRLLSYILGLDQDFCEWSDYEVIHEECKRQFPDILTPEAYEDE